MYERRSFWYRAVAQLGLGRTKRPKSGRNAAPHRKHLVYQALEERQLLAVDLSLAPFYQVVGNQDPAYTETGSNWQSWSGSGAYQGDLRYHAASDGSDTASWTLGSLDPTKSYQLFATWNAYGNHATNAPYTVLDGSTALATVQLNQQSAPDQGTLDGQDWQSLGVFRAEEGSLTVRLSDAANGYVVADAICAVEIPAATTVPTVVDNADPAYAETGGSWLGWTGTGAYQGDLRYAPAGTGQNTATWTFDNVDPAKQYQVYATWNAYGNHATNAPYTVLDGSTALATVHLNQQSAPDQASIDGQDWQSAGVYQAATGTLVVQLSDDANGYVVADAVRLVEVTAPTTPPTTTPAPVDNADPGYAESGGSWLGWTGTALTRATSVTRLPGRARTRPPGPSMISIRRFPTRCLPPGMRTGTMPATPRTRSLMGAPPWARCV